MLNFERIAAAREEQIELYKLGVVRVSDSGVHLTHEVFLENFETYEVYNRGCGQYPYGIQVKVSGVIYFAIMSEEDAQNAGVQFSQDSKA